MDYKEQMKMLFVHTYCNIMFWFKCYKNLKELATKDNYCKNRLEKEQYTMRRIAMVASKQDLLEWLKETKRVYCKN